MVDRWFRKKFAHPVNPRHYHYGIHAFMKAYVTEGVRGSSGSLHPAYEHLAKILEMGDLSTVQYTSCYSAKFLMWFTAVLIVATLAL